MESQNGDGENVWGNIFGLAGTVATGYFGWQAAESEAEVAAAQAALVRSDNAAKMDQSNSSMKWLIGALMVGGLLAFAMKKGKL